MSKFSKVELNTLDGLTLRGNLYLSSKRGPADTLAPGSVSRKCSPPNVAEAFQAANITVLTYDPRCTGASGGSPRQDIDRILQASDYSDALTFLAQHPLADPNRISFWGFSFSSRVILTATALDR